jgi:hypothetical protein
VPEEPTETEIDGFLDDAVQIATFRGEVHASEPVDDARDRFRDVHRIAAAADAFVHRFGDVACGVEPVYASDFGSFRREARLHRRVIEEREDVNVVDDEVERREDALCDTPNGIGLLAQVAALEEAEAARRVREDLAEERFLRLEVPVEDALADADVSDDVGYARAREALIGSQCDRRLHQLGPASFALGAERTAVSVSTVGH